MQEISVFCPATIANISCGFDVLGLCLNTLGDTITVKKVPEKGVRITKIKGAKLPLNPKKNVAGVAAEALLKEFDTTADGFEIAITKNILPGSGVGSSAASAAGAVFAINYLLGNPFSKTDLIRFAMKGEELASGAMHADNVAPAIYGGFTLVRSISPLDVIKIHTPKELYVTIIHPQIELKTEDSRAVLKKTVPLKKAIQQWGNMGALISGLYTENFDLISRSLNDVIIEPLRSVLIPHFYELKKAAFNAGALGSGIAGSGPSVFALNQGKDAALKVADAFENTYKNLGINYKCYVSSINHEGIKIIG